ncbi:hypothetical protein HYALB_00001725 [Hymenoscyphus albidus]|uniref:Uncharacterized protein n=1 Tax=Hymenoscyphus albidus TaxID=595503 RepID=A0A9N9LGT5_9HELO|nr:hypothetical protein HYALB_00001725 [Hymenoscyphus albidus]
MAGTKNKVLKTGNQNSKADIGGRPPKNKGQQEMKEKVRLATLKFDNHRKFVEEKKKKLEWLTHSYDNDADPQYKEENERLKKEVEGLVGNLMKYDMEFNRVAREEQASSSELPHIDLTGPDSSFGQLNTEDDADCQALFTPEQAREATGQGYGGKIVAWKKQIQSKPVIIMYGPRSAAKFECSTADIEEIDVTTPKFGPENRLGDEKVGRKLIRRKREFKAIQGLAYSCVVDDLKPKEKGEKGKRPPPLQIWVRWEISGKIADVWEIRSSIRHLWNSPNACDEYIYLAAKYHAARHQEWLDSRRQRQGKYISRTLAPGLGGLGNHTTNPSPHDAMLKYREQWCALEGIDSQKMDAAAKANFLLTWNLIEFRL